MNDDIWILISVLGTLAGVFVGNWLQTRNSKQQREWMLRDQKHEWLRSQRQEDFRRVETLIHDTLKLTLQGAVLDTMSTEKLASLLLEHDGSIASAMPVVYTIAAQDGELKAMLVEFDQKKDEAFEAMQARDISRLGKASRRIAELAGLMRQRMRILMAETFDTD